MNDYTREKPIGAGSLSPIGFPDSVNQFNSGDQNAPKSDEKLVVFFLNERLYAVAAHDVAEISHPVPVAVLPNSPAWLLGIGNLRGEIIAIVNLPALIGENPQTHSAKTKLIVLKTKNYETTIAFPVDKLSEIIASDDKNREAIGKTTSPYIYAEFKYQENAVRLIDSEKLLNSLAANS